MGLSRPSDESLEPLEPESWSSLGPGACALPSARFTVTADSVTNCPMTFVPIFRCCKAGREVNV